MVEEHVADLSGIQLSNSSTEAGECSVVRCKHCDSWSAIQSGWNRGIDAGKGSSQCRQVSSGQSRGQGEGRSKDAIDNVYEEVLVLHAR